MTVEKRRVRIADIKADDGYRQQAPRTFVEQLTTAMEPNVLRDALARLRAAVAEPFGTRPTKQDEQDAELTAALAEAEAILRTPAPAPVPTHSITHPVTVNERDGGLFIVDGWARLKALERLGVQEIDVEVEHKTREQEVQDFIDRNTKRKQL